MIKKIFLLLFLCLFSSLTVASSALADLASCQDTLISVLSEADDKHDAYLNSLQDSVTTIINYESETMSQAQSSVQNFIAAVAAGDREAAKEIANTWNGETKRINKFVKKQKGKVNKFTSDYKRAKSKFHSNVKRALKHCISEM